MDYLQITAIGDQIGFQRANCSKNKDPNKGGSDVSIALKKRKKRKDRNDELFTSFKNIDASVELGIGSNKSASEKKSGNRDYPQEINNRTSTIFILCKTFQQSMDMLLTPPVSVTYHQSPDSSAF